MKLLSVIYREKLPKKGDSELEMEEEESAAEAGKSWK